MFKNKLKVEVHIQGEIRTLLSPLIYKSKILNKEIVVPKGFKTNYGSIPMFFRNIIQNDGLGTYGYVIHDYLYAKKKYDKKTCDLVLKEALLELGFNKVGANIVYFALQIGGHKAYNN